MRWTTYTHSKIVQSSDDDFIRHIQENFNVILETSTIRARSSGIMRLLLIIDNGPLDHRHFFHGSGTTQQITALVSSHLTGTSKNNNS
jgi:hypothetical protein